MKVINLFKNYFQKMPFSATSINKILSGSRKEILVSLEILLLPSRFYIWLWKAPSQILKRVRCSVVYNPAALWTRALQAPLWDSPGNTGVGCYCPL